jgi:hypothetical protein
MDNWVEISIRKDNQAQGNPCFYLKFTITLPRVYIPFLSYEYIGLINTIRLSYSNEPKKELGRFDNRIDDLSDHFIDLQRNPYSKSIL